MNSSNQIWVPVAIIIGHTTAIGQYFKYKTTSRDFLVKNMVPTSGALWLPPHLVAISHYDKEGHLLNQYLAGMRRAL